MTNYRKDDTKGRWPDRRERCPSCGQVLRFKNNSHRMRGLIYAAKVKPMIEELLQTMTLQQIADKTGLDRSNLSDILHGRRVTTRRATAARILSLVRSVRASEVDNPPASQDQSQPELFPA